MANIQLENILRFKLVITCCQLSVTRASEELNRTGDSQLKKHPGSKARCIFRIPALSLIFKEVLLSCFLSEDENTQNLSRFFRKELLNAPQ